MGILWAHLAATGCIGISELSIHLSWKMGHECYWNGDPSKWDCWFLSYTKEAEADMADPVPASESFSTLKQWHTFPCPWYRASTWSDITWLKVSQYHTVKPALAVTWIRRSPPHCGQLGKVPKFEPIVSILYCSSIAVTCVIRNAVTLLHPQARYSTL